MRTPDEIAAAWRNVASHPLQTQNNDKRLDSAAIRAEIEGTSEWLRERADGLEPNEPVFHFETEGKRWSLAGLAVYQALLPELAALGEDEIAHRLINEIADRLIRDLVAAGYIAVLAAAGNIERARAARDLFEFVHPQMRCRALLAIASASGEYHDLAAARSGTDRMALSDKVRAYLDIYRLTNNPDDLFIARHAAGELEPNGRRAAFERIAAVTDDADDRLAALAAAEAIVDDGERFKTVLEVLWTIVHVYLSEGKSKMSRETLERIVQNKRLEKYPFWKRSAEILLEGDR